jgi:hypothetical protein
LALIMPTATADELHLRDGTVMEGSYIGGSQKEIWFQRTPAGPEVFQLFLVESLKFNSIPTLAPSASAVAPVPISRARGNAVQARGSDHWTGSVKWAFALFLPLSLAALLAHPPH